MSAVRSVGPVVCGTDFSRGAERAVDLAVAASRALGARLVIAHAMDLGAGAEIDVPRVVAPAERTLHAKLDARIADARRALEREARRAGGDVEVTLLHGRPWQAITAHADALDASMIVVGAHGATGAASIARDVALGWLLGTTADRVVRSAHRPVLVAPSEGRAPSLGSAEWLVAVAGDDGATRTLELALRLASRARSRARVIHVADGDPRAGGSDEDGSLEAVLAALTRDAAAAAEVAEAPEARVIYGRDPAAAILADAAQRAAVVVIGTHARKGLERALLGSVCERVLRASTLPVLLVPPPAPRGPGKG